MTLYRIDYAGALTEYGDMGVDSINMMIHDGVIIPVEPCEHGKYDGHLMNAGILCTEQACTDPNHWCPGAGLKEGT